MITPQPYTAKTDRAAADLTGCGVRLPYVAQLLGCDPKSIEQGKSELDNPSTPQEAARQRKKNGGHKKAETASPQVIENFHQVVKDHTAGDPMRADVKWTNLSRRQIAKVMATLGTPVSKNIVSRLLHSEGFRRRKPQKKRTMGQHAERNAQFEKIATLKKLFLDVGLPVISMDTKRRNCLAISIAKE